MFCRHMPLIEDKGDVVHEFALHMMGSGALALELALETGLDCAWQECHSVDAAMPQKYMWCI